MSQVMAGKILYRVSGAEHALHSIEQALLAQGDREGLRAVYDLVKDAHQLLLEADDALARSATRSAGNE